MLRHMDPPPYLPPGQFERMFTTNEFNKRTRVYVGLRVRALRRLLPQLDATGRHRQDYIIAQYDGAVAYMVSLHQVIFRR